MARYIEKEADKFKYYVVRNKETGLYFRGKGENKWGKYYNQASVYRFKKHAENAVEEETRRGNPTETVEIRIVEATADVAEVRHGRWEDRPNPQWKAYDIRHCSKCGWNIPKNNLRKKDLNWNYCPECGARMDGD